MPTTLTPAATFDTGISVPNDGEVVNRSSLETTFAQKLLNRTEFLATTYRTMSAVRAGPTFESGWIFNPTPMCWEQSTLTSSSIVLLPLAVPENAKITAFTVRLIGATGHAALPATMPTLRLQRIVRSTGAVTLTESLVDPTASVGAYEVAHDLTVTPISPHTGAGRDYYLQINGEFGTNSIVGLRIHAVTFTVAE